MTRLTGIKCDYCDTISYNKTEWISIAGIVRYNKDQFLNTEFGIRDFCCKECFLAWLREYVFVEE